MPDKRFVHETAEVFSVVIERPTRTNTGDLKDLHLGLRSIVFDLGPEARLTIGVVAEVYDLPLLWNLDRSEEHTSELQSH